MSTHTPGMLVEFIDAAPFTVFSEKGDAYYAVSGDPMGCDNDATLVIIYSEKQDCGEGVLSDYDCKLMVLCEGRIGWIFSSWVSECQ